MLLVCQRQKKPKLKIVGMKEKLENNRIVELMVKQNSFIKDGNNIRIEHTYEVKRNNRCSYTAIVEVDGNNYNNILNNKEVIIGWDICNAYEYFNITRCFKCCGFFHKAGKCSKQQYCAKCGKEHSLKDCKSEIENCVNCERTGNRLNLKLDSRHNAFNMECPVYKRMMANEKVKIDYNK
jgi:hypothetical protein